jgi:hypothetical protein
VEETKTITLPSGKKAVVRTYTTRGDDRQATELMNQGVKAETNEDGSVRMTFSNAALQASRDKYVELLTVSIDDVNCTPAILDSLHSDDYLAIETEILKITSVSDPKASSKS